MHDKMMIKISEEVFCKYAYDQTILINDFFPELFN